MKRKSPGIEADPFISILEFSPSSNGLYVRPFVSFQLTAVTALRIFFFFSKRSQERAALRDSSRSTPKNSQTRRNNLSENFVAHISRIKARACGPSVRNGTRPIYGIVATYFN